jgi:hypothetical protein
MLVFFFHLKVFSFHQFNVLTLFIGCVPCTYLKKFDLSKRFLDPYDNENFGKGEDPFSVDTFIAETNAGSVRWMNGLDKFPISTQSIQDGKLADHLLPLCGYSIEEESEMEFNFF